MAATTIDTETELSAVNSILGAIGQSPVTNLNKTNPEKYETKSFETKEIFTYSDYLVDTMTSHIDRERQKKAS